MVSDDKILDGSKVAAQIRAEVESAAAELAGRGVVPRLDTVLVGDDEASKLYVGSKQRMCAKLGLASESHILPADATQAEVEGLVRGLNDDPAVDGILVQLPLPSGLDTGRVIELIDPAKDVDGFHPANVGLLQAGRPRLVACTPAGVMEMLVREGVELKGANAVVVGRSDIVGKPMAMLLLHAHATVTICHSRTRDLGAVIAGADVLVAAIGRRGVILPEMVKDGAVVVDVGIHRVTERAEVEHLFPGDDKRLATFAKRGAVVVGDLDFTRTAPRASRITPVPGGVGPLTIAMLMSNTLRAARLRRGL